MKPNIIPVEFPNGGAIAAAAQNEDGTYTIYANTRFPQHEQESAVKDIMEGCGAMSNNEKFNAMLNECRHPKKVFNALPAFLKGAVRDER